MGQLVKIVKRTSIKVDFSGITQVVNKKGGIDRNYYDENGNLIGRPMRELTDEERKENEDIL